MTHYVLDASALIALFRKEAGAETVLRCLPGSRISTVNLSETIQKLVAYGGNATVINKDVNYLDVEIFPFEMEDAEATARLYTVTSSRGLSLADRACLALAARTGSTVLTADRSWKGLPVDVRVKLIR